MKNILLHKRLFAILSILCLIALSSSFGQNTGKIIFYTNNFDAPGQSDGYIPELTYSGDGFSRAEGKWYTNSRLYGEQYGATYYGNIWTFGTNATYGISGRGLGWSAVQQNYNTRPLGIQAHFDYYTDLNAYLSRGAIICLSTAGLRDITFSWDTKMGGSDKAYYRLAYKNTWDGTASGFSYLTEGGPFDNNIYYSENYTTVYHYDIDFPAVGMMYNNPNFQVGFVFTYNGDYGSVSDHGNVCIDNVIISACPYEGTISSTQKDAGKTYQWTKTGTNTTTLTIVGSHAMALYQWEQSYNNSTWTPIVGETSASYTTPTDLSVTTYYRCKVWYSEDACPGVYQINTFKVISDVACTPPTLSTPTANKNTLCEGETLNLSANVTATGLGCATWQYAWSDGTNYWNGTDFSSASEVWNNSYASISYQPGADNYAYTTKVRCASNASCNNTSTAKDITVTQSPAALGNKTHDYCINEAPVAATTDVVVGGGNTLYWANAKNGTYTTTAPVVATNAVGTTTYYFYQQNAAGCVSDTNTYTVTVSDKPAALGNKTHDYCINEAPVAATTDVVVDGGNTLYWANAKNGTYTTTAPVVATNAAGTTTYYFYQQNAAGCVSDTNTYTVTVSDKPAALGNKTHDYCINEVPVAATTDVVVGGGNTLYWATTKNGTYTTTAPVVATNAAGTTTYYFYQQNAAGCVSDTNTYTVTVSDKPATLGNKTHDYCINEAPVAATTDVVVGGGNTLYWANAKNGTYTTTAPVVATNAAGTTTYYFYQQNAAGCVSDTNTYTVTVSDKPAALGNKTHDYCINEAPVAATTDVVVGGGNTLYWANTKNGTYTTTAPVVATNAAGTTTYYFYQQNAAGCVSDTNTYTVTVSDKPAALGDKTHDYCINDAPVAATTDVVVGGGNTLYWATTKNGTYTTTAPVVATNAAGTTTYYFYQQNAAGCVSDTNTYTVTVSDKPAALGNKTHDYCINEAPVAATTDVVAGGGNTLYWATSKNGTYTATAPVVATNAAGTTTYYFYQQNAAGCVSDTNTYTVTVSDKPAALGNKTHDYCINEAPVAATTDVVVGGGNTLYWANAKNGTYTTTAPVVATNAVGTTTYYFYQQNAAGCVSDTNTYTVTVNPLLEENINRAICYGENFTIRDSLLTNLTNDTTFDWRFTNPTTCDSIFHVALKVHQPVVREAIDTLLSYGKTLTLHGKTYSHSDTLIDTVRTYDMVCDSIITTLKLYICPAPTYDTANVEICSFDSVYLENAYRNTPGPYHDTLYTELKCESVYLTTYLTVVEQPVKHDTVHICRGDSVLINCNYVKDGGTYPSYIVVPNKCDTLLQTTVIIDSIWVTIDRTICSNDPYGVDFGQYTGLKTSGFYYDTTRTAEGCDSITTLNLTVLDTAATTLTDHVCRKSEYHKNGFDITDLNTAGTYTYTNTLTAINGCDSVVTLNLTVLDDILTTLTDQICLGGVYNQYGFNITNLNTAGTFTYYDSTQVSALGCDSIVRLDLTVLPEITAAYEDNVCMENEYHNHGFDIVGPFVLGDTTFTHTTKTLGGCDSTTTLLLHVKSFAVGLGNDTAVCTGDDITLTASEVATTYAWTINGGASSITTRQLKLTIDETKIVQLTATDNYNCSATAQITITAKSLPNVSIDKAPDTDDMCAIALTASPANADSYVWSTGETADKLVITMNDLNNATTYSIRVSEGGCEAEESVSVSMEEFPNCDCDFYLPNVISPNNDSQNDYFAPKMSSVIKLNMIIYDRWGRKLFETNDVNGKWDGTSEHDGDCPAGVYFCVVKYVCANNPSKTITTQTSITLLR